MSHVDPELLQRLLEREYGLLSDAESASLEKQLASDPSLEAAVAEAKKTTDLFARAARVQAVGLKPQTAKPASGYAARETDSPELPVPSKRWLRWALVAAAGYLLMLAGAQWALNSVEQPVRIERVADQQLRLRAVPLDEPNRFLVETSTMAGRPVMASVQANIFAAGVSLFEAVYQTDASGRLALELPADLDVPKTASLNLVAHSETVPVDATLSVTLDPSRFITHLSLDKTLFRPGDTVRYRSLSVRRYNLSADAELAVHFEIHDPSGAVLAESVQEGVTERGVASGAFSIPPHAPGGRYELVARSMEGFFPEEVREFHVQQYRVPRLKKDLTFTRDSYGPGDAVRAELEVTRAEGGAASAATLRITAVVDDETVYETAAATSPAGTADVEFSLPESIERGGRLSVVIDDGGTTETITKTIPIRLDAIEVAFHPEGGDMAAGLENRVYFVARDATGAPVHIEGRILSSMGHEVARTETVHEGRGSFRFTPAFGETYRLVLDKPSDKLRAYELPAVSEQQRVVLSSNRPVFEQGEPLELTIASREAFRSLSLTAACRGVLVGEETVSVKPGPNKIVLPVDHRAGGVIRVTVSDAAQNPPVPLAERLVFRRHDRGLKVHIERAGEVPGDAEIVTAPGTSMELAIRVTDESGNPYPAALGVAVVDSSVLSLADDKSPSLRTHFLVTSEIERPEDLENADFFLSDDPETDVALDLLLGTQGWRRFVEKRLDELLADPAYAAQIQRLLELGGAHRKVAVSDNWRDVPDHIHHRTSSVAPVLRTFVAAGPAVGVIIAVALALSLVLRPRRTTAACIIGLATLSAAFVVGCSDSSRENAAPLANATTGSADATRAPATEPESQGAQEFAEGMMDDDAHRHAFVMQEPADPAESNEPPANADDQEFVNGELPPNAQQKTRIDWQVDSRTLSADVLRRWRAGALHSNDLQSFRFPVREYAHQHTKGQTGERTDFTETVYWHPLLITDAEGRATVKFDVSDSVTTYRVLVDSHGDDGRLGTGHAEVISRLPFHLEPKLPLVVTTGDRIDLPVAVVNDSPQDVPVTVELEASSAFKLDGSARRELTLAAAQRGREIFSLDVVGSPGEGTINVRGLAGGWFDAVKRPLRIEPAGFPASLSVSGVASGAEHPLSITLPDEWEADSLDVKLRFFPTALASVQQGLDAMLREPGGCFEQATSSNYPNVLALRYLQQQRLAHPELTRRAKGMLDRGYRLLTGYECTQRGYEWFGSDPGHEALTAFGLMEFRDMQAVYEVDTEMLDRTTKWLLDRRNGQGGFERNSRHLHVWSVTQDIVDAYIVWALTEAAGERMANVLSRELDHVAELAHSSNDPYLIALVAGSLLNAGHTDEGDELLDKLVSLQADDGHLQGTSGSVTQSQGFSLQAETTSLAVLAWLKRPAYAATADRAMAWMNQNRQGPGNFGSTQATVLALKAMLAHSEERATVPASAVVVKQAGEVIGRFDIPPGHQDPIAINGLAQHLEPGANDLSLTVTPEGGLPYTLDVQYRAAKPVDTGKCPIQIDTELSADDVAAGDVVSLHVTLNNTTDNGQPTPVAIVGIPAGLEPRTKQLDELKETGLFDYYELRPREIILYWRDLAPKQTVDVDLELTAEIPGRFTGPASRCYLYYTAENKSWADPLKVEIAKP